MVCQTQKNLCLLTFCFIMVSIWCCHICLLCGNNVDGICSFNYGRACDINSRKEAMDLSDQLVINQRTVPFSTSSHWCVGSLLLYHLTNSLCSHGAQFATIYILLGIVSRLLLSCICSKTHCDVRMPTKQS